MFLRPSLKLVIFLIIITANILAFPRLQKPTDQLGTLKGTVVDVHDARVVTTKILIVGKRISQELSVDMNGEFEINLPPGKYRLIANAQGFYKYHQKNIQLEKGKNITLCLKLKIAPQRIGKCSPGHVCL